VATSTITTSSGAVYTIPTMPTVTPVTTGQIYVSGGGNGGGGGIMNTGVLGPSGTTRLSNSNGKTVLTIPSSNEPSILIDGSIKWNGEDLNDRLKRIEAVLHIPTRDVTMEEKYKKLKSLWEQYHKALDEYKTWETLKESK
jgi:hypothetical protein